MIFVLFFGVCVYACLFPSSAVIVFFLMWTIDLMQMNE